MCLRPVVAGLRSTGAGQGRAWRAYYRGKCAGGTSRRPCLILRLLGPVGEVVAGLQGFWVLGAQHLLEHCQQRGVLVPRPGRIPRHSGQNGEVAADEQGGRVLEAGHALTDRQQREYAMTRQAAPAIAQRSPGTACGISFGTCRSPTHRSAEAPRASSTAKENATCWTSYSRRCGTGRAEP